MSASPATTARSTSPASPTTSSTSSAHTTSDLRLRSVRRPAQHQHQRLRHLHLRRQPPHRHLEQPHPRFPRRGINCFDVEGSHDLLDLSYNHIHDTSKYSPNNTSGISICSSRDLTNGATFADGYGYRVIGNYIHDVQCLVPYTPGGFDVITDGNAISLDQVTTAYGYRKPLLVAGNIVTNCGGRGVLAYETSNVRIIDNTAVGNLTTHSPAITGGVELQANQPAQSSSNTTPSAHCTHPTAPTTTPPTSTTSSSAAPNPSPPATTTYAPRTQLLQRHTRPRHPAHRPTTSRLLAPVGLRPPRSPGVSLGARADQVVIGVDLLGPLPPQPCWSLPSGTSRSRA